MDSQEKQRRRRRVLWLRRLLLCALVLWGLLGLIGLFTVVRYVAQAANVRRAPGGERVETECAPETERAAETGTDGGVTETAEAGAYVPTEEERARAKRLRQESPELLVLVNLANGLDESYDPGLRTICDGRLQASERLYDDLVALLAAADKEGYQYWIASAYRSRTRQQELIDEDVQAFMEDGMNYEEALAETLAETMPAGHSEHETGLALDLLCSGNTRMDRSQADEPGNAWLLAHCAEYGFILRYPDGREETTGINYEPWHFRYVGREAAEFIMERGLVLEDFWEL